MPVLVLPILQVLQTGNEKVKECTGVSRPSEEEEKWVDIFE
jgi:hypothetical protein